METINKRIILTERPEDQNNPELITYNSETFGLTEVPEIENFSPNFILRSGCVYPAETVEEVVSYSNCYRDYINGDIGFGRVLDKRVEEWESSE